MSIRESSGIIYKQITNRSFLVNAILKKIWVAFAFLIILAAVSSSIFRALTPWATQYKGEVEHHLSVLLGQPVTVRTMQTGWYWFQPVLKLEEITISDGANKSLHLDKLLVGINLFKSLWEWQIQPGVLYIDDINLVLREKDGHWSIDGISTSAMDGAEMTPARTQQILIWLAEQERLIIRHVSAHLHFSDGGLIPISGLNISVINRGGSYKLKGDAKLDQTDATSFQLLGDVRFDPYHLEKTKGQIYFSAKNVVPAQWQSIFPKTAQQLEGGKGTIALWLDLNRGAISSMQAQVEFKHLAWRLLNKKGSQLIQSVSANMALKLDDLGWKLNADHVHLRMGGIEWPENKVSVTFNKEQQSYQMFVHSIIIESVLSEAINWPESIQNSIKVKPHGLLSNTQISIKDNQLTTLLTRFDSLAWDANESIPAVENLSGVLNWQPQEGHLELDSENVLLKIKGYPKQNLSLLNGSFEWKELNDGFRLSIERFILSQKDLTLSAEGALDQVTLESIGHIRLNADYSGKNLQQWIPYIPANYLKPTLLKWLKHDVKRIGEATGSLKINGFAKDFPFDTSPGEFSLVSHTSGTDLIIAPKWPLITDLDGYIKVNKRNFNVDLVHGDFHGVPVNQMNLRIDDIGNDKEVLLLTGTINAKAQKMLDFVMSSPLRKKLSTLEMLTLKGLLLANIHVEIPLYTESDDVLVKGDLSFKNNTAYFAHQIGKLKLEDLSGTLNFDEKGINDSALVASALGYPLNIKIQSVAAPEAYTKILLNGECTIDSLKSRLNTPIFSFLKGMFFINAELKLTDNPNDFDSMILNTDLQGLAVNVPDPIGKTAEAKTPLQVKLDFNSKNGIRVRADYAGRISSDVLFHEKNGSYAIKSGQVKLGGLKAVDQNKPGLAIEGKLDGFVLQDWNSVIKQFNTDTTKSDLAHNLRIIDVQLGKLSLLNQNFDNMSVKAKILADNDWSFTLEQSNIAGDLVYHALTNTLSGHVSRLHLAELQSNKNNPATTSQYHPDDIPNLNVRLDNLSIGVKQIGNITLKSKSSPGRLTLEYCRIESPVYQFMMQGAWTQNNKINKTQLQLKAHLNDLAKSMERWDIAPAIKAGKGDLEFNGSWNNTLFDPSLASLNGTLYLKLKKGIITHLSPETEEKLGLGKLLSILSLQTIPRRLQLDFSDLSHEGYSFDIFKGNFNVSKGIMTTEDSYLDGPVAYAGMKGDLDLVHRMYDLNLSISPHITASLPVVATIAGGPIAGLAAWVANKIINQGMQKIIAYSYKISGPWNQPVVQQLSMVRKDINKVDNSPQVVAE